MLRVADSYPSAGVSALGVVASAPVRRSLGAESRGQRAGPPESRRRESWPTGVQLPVRVPARDFVEHHAAWAHARRVRCGLRFRRRFDRCPLGDAIELPLEVDDVRRGDVSL